MKKKNASLVALVLLSVFTVLSFLPIVFTQHYWKDEKTYGLSGSYYHLWSKNISLFSPPGQGLLAAIVVLLAVVGIVALAFQVADSKNKLWSRLCFASVGAAVLFTVEVILVLLKVEHNGDNGYWAYNPAWGFYIMAALLLASVVLSLLIAVGKLKNDTPQLRTHSQSIPTPQSNAEELARYKQLLDAGAITLQEYEAKKRQLLEL